MSHLNLVKLPLVGRASAFNQLIGSFQQAQQGQPQAVLVVGEAGIGKTRLVTEFVAWAQSQGAEVLSGYAIAMGGRLPYQLPVEALRQRMQAENAPENLVEDLWLAELARLLPELRVRYPDLPAPTHRWCYCWRICTGWMGLPSTYCATWEGIGRSMAAGCCC